ncbi:prepilin-type N-terminal cleavage/methylation domain-containing protein [Fontibacillus sp. BL9]|uniref:prepilin-type N-terminal cleavage/methylation domain-containing protein n=1 Tax=Fontibacillus sp. BL9 TaxID=3389971 RepID=UPI00397B00AF
MTALIQRLRKEEKGLTLIELLAVIVIIGVIAAIAVPIITGVIKDTKDSARVATANQLFEAAKLRSIAQNNGVLKGEHTLTDLLDEDYIQKGLTDPKSGKAFGAGTQVNLSDLTSTTATIVTLVTDDGTLNYTLANLKNGDKGSAPPTSEGSGS